MSLRKKVVKNEEKIEVFFVDENNLKQGKSKIFYNKKDEVLELEYLDGNMHGYCFIKNKKGDILKEEGWWYGYICKDKERFKKLMTEFRLEMIEKKYKF